MRLKCAFDPWVPIARGTAPDGHSMITITAPSGRRRRRIDRKVKATPFVTVLVGFPNSQKGNECGHERRRLFFRQVRLTEQAHEAAPTSSPEVQERALRTVQQARTSTDRDGADRADCRPDDRPAGTSWSDASGWAWAGQATRCQRQARIRALDREVRELRQVQEIPRKAPDTWPRRSPTAGMNRPHPHGHRRRHHRDVSPDGLTQRCRQMPMSLGTVFAVANERAAIERVTARHRASCATTASAAAACGPTRH